MRRTYSGFAIAVLIILTPIASLAQTNHGEPSVSVPHLIHISGAFRPADGQPAASVETITLSIYAEPEGGLPLWQETQAVVLDEHGRYALLLGATRADGIPLAVFTSGAQWLGIRFERLGEVEGPRVRIASVPYALRAADADMLGGRPASEYLLVGKAQESTGGKGRPDAVAPPEAILPGSANFLSKYVSGADLGVSSVFESGGRVGIGTASPMDALHVQFSNEVGTMTGVAVQNLGTTQTSYSGMLFFDQNGVLGQFQGFNNSTHEYRINNIGRNGTGQFDGSIKFMIGSSPKFMVASTGNIGIGAEPGPTEKLHVAGNVVVDGNIGAKYQDVAEWVKTAAPLDAGTVVIVDPRHPNHVLMTARAYDTRVAGAVSRQPGLLLGEQADGTAMIAQSGRVRVKADASYGAIRIGDLLVTSPTPGYAMRSQPIHVGRHSLHRPGTLLGKALEALPAGKGEILVLLTLQ